MQKRLPHASMGFSSSVRWDWLSIVICARYDDKVTLNMMMCIYMQRYLGMVY